MPTDETRGGESAQTHPASPAAFGGAPLPYMRWAKAFLEPNPLSLGLSGLSALPADVRRSLGLSPPPEIGDPTLGLKAALAARYGLAPENVLPAAGTSHANFAVFFALARGGHVVVETPAYEALPALGSAVAGSLATVQRDPERRWRFDPISLEQALRPDTALIVTTDLHNPSGLRMHPEDLDLLVAAAEASDAYLLIDEVYADFDPQERPTAALRSPRVLVTSSLTKVHGLPDLRAGWILGDAGTLAEIDAWNDLVHPSLPPALMAEAARYIPQGHARLEATRASAARCAAIVDDWVQATDGVRWLLPDGGLTGFLLLEDGVDGDEVSLRLGDVHGVRVVPGSFFQIQSALRISFHLEARRLQEALDALGSVLEDVR